MDFLFLLYFTSYFMFSIAVLPYSPGVGHYHFLTFIIELRFDIPFLS